MQPTWSQPGADLYLGDCLSVLPMLPDESVDFIFTDPPYGHNNNNNGDLSARWEFALGRVKNGTAEPGLPRPIANDGPEANDFFRAFLVQAERLLRPGCCCCFGGGGGPEPQFARWCLWLDEVLQFKQMVVWDKGPMGMGWHYRRSYETILVAQKGKGKCRWYDTTRQVENVIRPGDLGIAKIIPGQKQHPTAKPINLALYFLRLHSRPGDVVLDPFMGSGSTGLACQQMERRFVGIELDPDHFAMAQQALAAGDGPLFAPGAHLSDPTDAPTLFPDPP